MGVSSNSVKFPLSSLDGYSSGDDESSDRSSGNDEPMTRGRDRLESAELKGPVDMQSALSDRHISSPSPTEEMAYKISVPSGCDVCSDPVPGIGESKTRGRVRRKKVKKGARPRTRPPFKGFHLSVKSVKRPINRLKGRRKIMAAHHYRLKPGENSASSLWLKQKQPRHHSKLKGRKKVMVAHHYWLKPGEDIIDPERSMHVPFSATLRFAIQKFVFPSRWFKIGRQMAGEPRLRFTLGIHPHVLAKNRPEMEFQKLKRKLNGIS